MYCADRIQERLAMAQLSLKRPIEYHSVDEVDKFNHHLDSDAMTWNADGERVLRRELYDWEVSWMDNERALSMCDADYWLTRYAMVKDEANIIRRFKFRIPQKLYFDIIADLEKKLSAIELQILKARQLGMSTITELLLAHRIIFGYGVNAILGSADRQKTMIMSKMVFLAYDHLPWWMPPVATRRVESDQGLFEFGKTNSGVSFQHGAQVSGIGRGTTPTVYHLSEVASFTDPENQIEASIFKAVHAHPNIFGVLESTAEGDDNWWADKWKFNKIEYARGRARLCPLFLPWFCGTDIYPTPTWRTMHPIPGDWRPDKDTQLHIRKAELYVRSNDLLGKHLGRQWRMPDYQQWFWEVGHLEAKRTGTEATWFQEMCGDDIEAFQNSYDNVFGRELIEVIDTQRIQDFAEYAIVGDGIDERYEPEPADVDYSAERIRLKYATPKSETPYRWELIPLKPSIDPGMQYKEIYESVDYTNRLYIFHPPRPGVDYSIGVDTGGGHGGDHDNTSISVIEVGKRDMPDVEVAEWASSLIGHVEAYAFTMAIAALYKSHYSEESRSREPLVSIEQLKAVGDTTQLQMRKMGYSNFYKFVRFDGKNIDKSRSNRLGWYTTGWSRPMLIDGFVHSVRNGWIIINSPFVLGEMDKFEIHYTKSGKEKQEHADGWHDDRLFSKAIATFCAHDLDLMVERAKRKYQQQLVDKPRVDLSDYCGNRINPKQNDQVSKVEMSELLGRDLSDRFIQ